MTSSIVQSEGEENLASCCDLDGEIVAFGKLDVGMGTTLVICGCTLWLTLTGGVTSRSIDLTTVGETVGGEEEDVAAFWLEEGDPPKAALVDGEGTPGKQRNVRTFS